MARKPRKATKPVAVTGDILTGNPKDQKADVIKGAPTKEGWTYRGARSDTPELFISPAGKTYRWARPRERADLVVQLRYAVSPGRLREVVPPRRSRRTKRSKHVSRRQRTT